MNNIKRKREKPTYTPSTLENILYDARYFWLPLKFWRKFFDALSILKRNKRLMLVGPTGSGKSIWSEILYLAIFYPSKLLAIIPPKFRKNFRQLLDIDDYDEENPPPFVKISAGEIADGTAKSDLLGYAGNSFTGASREGSDGTLLGANGGILFIDESQELTLPVQASFLRFLDDHKFKPVGGSGLRLLDAYIVFSVNRHPALLSAEQTFRSDLRYRFSCSIVTLVPLIDWHSDNIFSLGKHILKKVSADSKRTIRGFSHSAERLIKLLPWRGGLREFVNSIKEAATRCNRELIQPYDFPLDELGINVEDLRRKEMDLEKKYSDKEREVKEYLLSLKKAGH